MSIAQQEVGTLLAPRWAFVPLCDLYIALACVCILSSTLALAQALFDWYPFPVWSGAPGLFFNPMAAGEIAALTIIMLVVNRLYWFIPALLPGLYLGHSRGAWAALGLGLLATQFRKPLWLLVLVLALGLLYSIHPSSSDLERLHIWRAAWINLTFWGNGLGSFENVWIGLPAVQPVYAHNDYLQAVFELGVWSMVPFSILAWALSRTSARDWPTLVTVSFMACFSMPMHMPITAILGALALATTLGANNA